MFLLFTQLLVLKYLYCRFIESIFYFIVRICIARTESKYLIAYLQNVSVMPYNKNSYNVFGRSFSDQIK